MNAVLAWLFFAIMSAVGIVIWYVTEPIVYALSNWGLVAARNAGTNTTGLEQGVQMVQTFNVLWIGIVLAVLLIYAIIASTSQEGIGYYR